MRVCRTATTRGSGVRATRTRSRARAQDAPTAVARRRVALKGVRAAPMLLGGVVAPGRVDTVAVLIGQPPIAVRVATRRWLISPALVVSTQGVVAVARPALVTTPATAKRRMLNAALVAEAGQVQETPWLKTVPRVYEGRVTLSMPGRPVPMERRASQVVTETVNAAPVGAVGARGDAETVGASVAGPRREEGAKGAL